MAADHPTGQASSGPPVPENGLDDGTPGAPPSLEQAFDGGSLYALRAAVAAHASAAGLSAPRVYDVVAAAHEMAANTIRHGAGHGLLRLRSDGQALYCEVTDDGPARPDHSSGPATGAPPWPHEHAHGLWLIDQVADRFSIDRGPAGTTASACFTITPLPDAPDEAMSRKNPT
jgi:anti-sigma regulatory factor (Ser/Thr protein kinase)